MTAQRILVIKLGAFGDFIQALGPMAAIRHHHPEADITLLTTAAFVTLARESGYFSEIWVDDRPKIFELRKWLSLGARLRGGRFTRVYDLQNNDRTALYLRLFGRNRPQWIGSAPGASHRNRSPERVSGHAFDGHKQTLALAGIHDVAIDDLGWVRGDAVHFGLPHPFVLIVPGCAPDRPEKRWPAESFGMLAQDLYKLGFTPVITGTLAEDDLAKIILARCPQAINLCGQTSMTDLVLLARAAAGAVGNDTGPMHIIGPTGCPAIVLFSAHSDPEHHRPLGPRVRILNQSDEIPELITAKDFRHTGAVNVA